MNNLDWIKELVLEEQRMEDSGVVQLHSTQPENYLEEHSLEFLRDAKAVFIEAISTFNHLKGSALGTIKIYGISNTKADFMLFRNGYKLIFSMRRPGEIEIYNSITSSHFLAPDSEKKVNENDVLRAQWGAFGELNWQYRNLNVKIDYLVRHYMSLFIRESTK
jgi:hypothetical protein